MGWWWGQEQREPLSPEIPTPTIAQPPSAGQSEEQRTATRPAADTANKDLDPSAGGRVLSRNEQAYEELKSLFAEIDPQKSADAATRAKEYVERPKEDHSDSLYASTMSCSQCFDQAYYCSSVGGQLNSVYRYGALRSCTELWQQWRFCMRTKVMSEDTRKTKIREWNQRRAGKYKMGPSSEDVWEVRKEPVEKPFSRPYQE